MLNMRSSCKSCGRLRLTDCSKRVSGVWMFLNAVVFIHICSLNTRVDERNDFVADMHAIMCDVDKRAVGVEPIDP
jgi:hypothetical protein